MTDATINTYQGLRPYLFSVAYRFTGSASDAEDLVHDAWVRYLAAGSPPVDSLRAYLTTIVSRLSLDYLKSARVRREEYIGPWLPEPILTVEDASDPSLAVERQETVSMALLTLLDHLTPDQRIVYVLRESLGLGFDEIANHLGRTAASCRQLFRRARQQLAASDHFPAQRPEPDLTRRFLVALSTASVPDLVEILAEDVVWLSDRGPHRTAARNPIHGRDRVSRGLAGIVRRFGDESTRVTPAQLNGEPGLILWRANGISSVVQWSTSNGAITHLWFSRNPHKLAHVARQLGATIAPA